MNKLITREEIQIWPPLQASDCIGLVVTMIIEKVVRIMVLLLNGAN